MVIATSGEIFHAKFAAVQSGARNKARPISPKAIVVRYISVRGNDLRDCFEFMIGSARAALWLLRFSLDLSPEFFVLSPFALSDLLLGQIQYLLKLRRIV